MEQMEQKETEKQEQSPLVGNESVEQEPEEQALDAEEEKKAEAEKKASEEEKKSFLSGIKKRIPFARKEESDTKQDPALSKIMSVLGTDDPDEALRIIEEKREKESKKTKHEELLEKQLGEKEKVISDLKKEAEDKAREAKMMATSAEVSSLLVSNGVSDEKIRSLIAKDLMSHAKLTEKGECYFEIEDTMMTASEAVGYAKIEYKSAFPKQQNGPQTSNAGKVMEQKKDDRYYLNKNGERVPINHRGLLYHPFKNTTHISELQILGNTPRRERQKKNPMN